MAVEENDYFAFMVPAMILMIAGMEFPIMREANANKALVSGLKKASLYLQGKSGIGKVLMVVGAISGFLSIFLPAGLDYVGYLLGKLLFVGIFYIIFSDVKNKRIFILIGVAALLIIVDFS
jgi:hypothetical protein